MASNLYVGNMSFSTTEESLRETFSAHGTVTKVQVVTDRETGHPRGFAFIEMSEGGDAAIQALDGSRVDGRTLTVDGAAPREERPRSGVAVAGMAERWWVRRRRWEPGRVRQPQLTAAVGAKACDTPAMSIEKKRVGVRTAGRMPLRALGRPGCCGPHVEPIAYSLYQARSCSPSRAKASLVPTRRNRTKSPHRNQLRTTRLKGRLCPSPTVRATTPRWGQEMKRPHQGCGCRQGRVVPL